MTEGGSASCAASAVVNNREEAASRERCSVRGNGQCAARTARNHGPRAWLEIEWICVPDVSQEHSQKWRNKRGKRNDVMPGLHLVIGNRTTAASGNTVQISTA
jgi:hypothetical protein